MDQDLCLHTLPQAPPIPSNSNVCFSEGKCTDQVIVNHDDVLSNAK